MIEHQRVLVRQREAGIIAPIHDRNRVTQIMTDGMWPCYALMIYDPRNLVAMLAHVDNWGDLNLVDLLNQNAPIMRSLGAEEVHIATGNAPESSSNRLLYLDDAIDQLYDHGLKVRRLTTGERAFDYGRANGVTLTAHGDVKVYPDSKVMPRASYPVEKLSTLQRMLKEITHNKRMFSKDGFRMAYLPNV